MINFEPPDCVRIIKIDKTFQIIDLEKRDIDPEALPIIKELLDKLNRINVKMWIRFPLLGVTSMVIFFNLFFVTISWFPKYVPIPLCFILLSSIASLIFI